MKNIIIFTDLDGTLLDYSTYSFEDALPALYLLKQLAIPFILCSSKTRKEIEYYRKKLDNSHPFISENGGGIFIPKNYFGLTTVSAQVDVVEENDYTIVRLGAQYPDLRMAVESLRKEGFDVRGFGDMSVRELAKTANMNREEAQMAKMRDFDEPFIFNGPPHKLPELFESISEKGYKFTQGRFFHILGSSNKGIAVSILIELYKTRYGDIRTIAIGDSPNDIPMLESVDLPVLVQKQDGTYDPQIDMPKLIKAEGIGPLGWNKAVLEFIMK